jgi:hypothetical protein
VVVIEPCKNWLLWPFSLIYPIFVSYGLIHPSRLHQAWTKILTRRFSCFTETLTLKLLKRSSVGHMDRAAVQIVKPEKGKNHHLKEIREGGEFMNPYGELAHCLLNRLAFPVET